MRSGLRSSDARVARVLIASAVLCICLSHRCQGDPSLGTSEALARYDPVFGNACGAVNLYAALRILGKDGDREIP